MSGLFHFLYYGGKIRIWPRMFEEKAESFPQAVLQGRRDAATADHFPVPAEGVLGNAPACGIVHVYQTEAFCVAVAALQKRCLRV